LPTLPSRPRGNAAGAACSAPARSARGLAHTSVDLGKTLISQTLLTLEDHSHPAMIARSPGLVSAASTAILAKLLILPPDRPTVFKGELSAIKRVVWSQPLDLAKIKEIGRAFDATINDVLVAAVAGALRDYMLQAQDDPNAGNINAMVPVNLRPLDRKQASWATNLPLSTCRWRSACPTRWRGSRRPSTPWMCSSSRRSRSWSTRFWA
jgi:hypothetical protein